MRHSEMLSFCNEAHKSVRTGNRQQVEIAMAGLTAMDLDVVRGFAREREHPECSHGSRELAVYQTPSRAGLKQDNRTVIDVSVTHHIQCASPPPSEGRPIHSGQLYAGRGSSENVPVSSLSLLFVSITVCSDMLDQKTNPPMKRPIHQGERHEDIARLPLQ
jgi:hypothetical protein